jgi:hypothetical protein
VLKVKEATEAEHNDALGLSDVADPEEQKRDKNDRYETL